MMLKLAILAVIVALSQAGSPNVQVYTYKMMKEGEPNVLLCHVKNFSPPNIKLELLENGIIIPNTTQSDLSFESDWSFKLTRHVEFTPHSGVKYACRVTHNDESKVVQLDAY
ncbi:beta-2-microglobulin-like [Stegostoma tigrinum]|uniref:beta-2-microglobulin-like n=1 Tax=Stegostoma tigrinum TaxID=3053191 RepID=UPI00202B5040|nr:beta-2-microglobulin-like [Stegostoma tigrinum]XP_048376245.1 beta-2-microglobulin-like [Stegostoma tigrinum]